ncbi:MAG: DUF4476 domain-containing protein [Bacteroidetes bacterium]|nr:DUF4476 domain-containing protein [Bacteroidota bacterium]
MKKFKLYIFLIVCVLFSNHIISQDCGMLKIKNVASKQEQFIATLNGVRLLNTYTTNLTFTCLTEQSYTVQLLIAGVSNPMLFNAYSSPNYICTYILNKDMFNRYSLVLENKSLINFNDPSNSVSTPTLVPTYTAASTPTVIESSVTIAIPTETTNTQLTQNSSNNSNTLTTTPTPTVISDNEFNGIINMLKKEHIETNRLNLAKTFLKNKNINSSQVVKALNTFYLERNKLDISKHLYAQTIDKSNYYNVINNLSLSGSKKELSEYINNFK